MRNWATLVQAVDVPLTNEAFDGVFGAMAAISIAYTLTHVYGLISIILVSNVIESMDHTHLSSLAKTQTCQSVSYCQLVLCLADLDHFAILLVLL